MSPRPRAPKVPSPVSLLGTLAYSFHDPSLLQEALTHRSSLPTTTVAKGAIVTWNERLEFLGDAVLSLVLSTELIQRPERFQEGDLSKIRAALVNERSLAELARSVNLGQYLVLGKGEIKGGGRQKDSVLADAMEALLGAIYLDGGLSAAQAVVLKLYDQHLQTGLSGLLSKDYKSQLQEAAQQAWQAKPEYYVVNTTGPDHEPMFEIEVRLRGEVLGHGTGPNKKAASQAAAQQALAKFAAFAAANSASPCSSTTASAGEARL